MNVFYRHLTVLMLPLMSALILPLSAPMAADYQVVEQATNQGTFYAYHNQEAPQWWHMAIPDVAAYAYNSSSTAFFIRPAGTENIYKVNLLKRLDKLPAARMKRQDVSGVEVAGYQDIHQWQVHVYNQFCGSVLASKAAAEDMRLNFVDQVRISQGLRTAFSQKINRRKPCDDFHIPAVMGRLVGYGLALEGRKIKSDVTAITEADSLPEDYLTREQIKTAKPLSAQGRLDLLLAALPPERREVFKKRAANQPAEAVIRAVQAQMANGE